MSRLYTPELVDVISNNGCVVQMREFCHACKAADEKSAKSVKCASSKSKPEVHVIKLSYARSSWPAKVRQSCSLYKEHSAMARIEMMRRYAI